MLLLIPDCWHIQYAITSCPMFVTQVLMTQGLENGSQVCDCQHDGGGQQLTEPADTWHIPQGPLLTTFQYQHEQTTAPA